jgi:hypothetical protein
MALLTTVAALVAAIAAAAPGKVIEVKAGSYTLPGGAGCGLVLARSGTPAARIVLRAVGGVATLDAGRVRDPSGWDNVGVCLRGDHWDVANIAVRGARQTAARVTAAGWFVTGTGNVLTNARAFENGGPGFLIRRGGNVLRQPRAYRNRDPLTGGGNADGIGVSRVQAGDGPVLLVGAVARDNSDDGVDLWETEVPVTIRGGASERNGWVPGTRTPAGDGTGYKLGRNDDCPTHTLLDVTARANRGVGVDFNGGCGATVLRGSTVAGNLGWAQIELSGKGDVVEGNVIGP